jgi:hypothetical protein
MGSPWSPFLYFLNRHFKLSKTYKKFLDVDNDDFYLHAENQCEIFCVLGCVKINVQEIGNR